MPRPDRLLSSAASGEGSETLSGARCPRVPCQAWSYNYTMNVMRYKDHTARVEFDAEDELFTGRLAGINDIVGFHGATVDELKSAFREAVDDYIAHCAEIGKPPEQPYSGKMMFRVSPEI